MGGTPLLAVGLLAVAGALALAGAQLAGRVTGPTGIARRLAHVGTIYARHRGQADGERPEQVLGPSLDRLRALAARLSPRGARDTLQQRLDRAGAPPRWTPERVLGYKGAGLVLLCPLGALYGLSSPAKLVLCALIGAAAGFFLPDVVLYNAATKRQAAIARALPDTLDMLTICVEAGLGFDAAVDRVGRNTVGPLAAELTRMVQETQFGKSRVEALRSLAERTTVAELRTFASSLLQATELGIPVAQVLREQAREMRLKRRQLAEEKAQKVPVKILFPLLLCVFPALFIVIIGPGAISIMDTLGGR